MNSKIKILTLPTSRWQEYKKLRLESLKKDPQAFGAKFEEAQMKPDSEWIERVKSAEKGEKDILLFAENEEKLVGMVGAYFNKSKENEGIATIGGFYVIEKCRGKGVGNKLIEEIILKIKKIPTLYKIKLYVNRDQKSALHVYQKFGFIIVGTEHFVLGDGIEHSELIMEKIIDDKN